MTSFVPREAWPDFDTVSTIPAFLRPRKINGFLEYGIFPFFLSVWYGDEKPTLPSKKYLWPRLFVWDRVTEKKKEINWLRLGGSPRKLLALLYASDDSYALSWNKTARYQKNVWEKIKGKGFEIKEVDVHNFREAYRKSATWQKLDPVVRVSLMNNSEERKRKGDLRVGYFIFLKNKTDTILGGLSYESSRVCPNSYYTIGFVHSYHEKLPVMTALFVEWIERERKEGVRWFNFGILWKKGDPKSWKGYSEFKKKYGVIEYGLPQSLGKIKWFW
jgi:hypothetical protein